jgi:heme-degrading monooxygenase HmoA
MATVITRRKLEPNSFEGWKARFEEGATARKNAGCRGVRRFRGAADPDEVIVIMDWDSHENARKFIEANVRAMIERNPGTPPVMQTVYVEEFEPLPS